jgi:hypothetical protein
MPSSDFSINIGFIRALVSYCSLVTAYAFQSPFSSSRVSSALNVAVDPTVITKKEFQDVCGVEFDTKNLQERLKATNFLYPKHVEVIEDIAPIAGAMVDDIVSVNVTEFCVGATFDILCKNSSHFFAFLNRSVSLAVRDWRESLATPGLSPRSIQGGMGRRSQGNAKNG